MKKVSQHLILIAWLFAAVTAACADIIVLRDGREYDGALERATDETVFFRQEGELREYPRGEVVHIRLQKTREWDEYDSLSNIPDEQLQRAFALPIKPADYPGSGSVVLYREIVVDLRTPRTWQRDERNIIRILNEHGEDESVREILYRPDCETAEILHGITVRPNGDIEHVRDTAVQEESLYHQFARYDTLRRRRFALPEGKPGVVLDAAVHSERHTPLASEFFYEEFLLGGVAPAIETAVSVVVPEGVSLRWTMLNDADGAVQHSVTHEKGAVKHTWRRMHAPQLIPEPMMPPLADIIPRLVVSTDSRSWEEIGSDYGRMLAERQSAFPDLPAPPSQNIDELWAVVSRNIQEAPVSLLASGWQPLDPEQTLRLRNGSQLDRTYLLFRWLQAAGHAVRWAWIRPRTAGGLASDVPALAAMSMPAILVTESGQERFLVVGDDLAAMAEPVQMLSASPALVVGDEELTQLPMAMPAAAGTDRQVKVLLNDAGDAQVTDRITYRGPDARGFRAWRGLTSEEIVNLVTQMTTDQAPRAEHITYTLEGDVRQNEPEFTLTLQYRVPRLADSGRLLASLQPPWLAYQAGDVGRAERQFPMFWRWLRNDRVTVTVVAPPSWHLAGMPGAQECGGTIADMQIAVDGENGASASCAVEYQRNVLAAPVAAYNQFKECLELRAAAGRQYWVWQK
jgi:hypothetical protein